jgi:hypothetical protein
VLVVAVLDVGSATRTGWWRSPLAGPSTEGRNVDELCAELADDLFSGNAVAVGFEAPLWVPYANDATQLGKARPGEHPSWSAGAGATVLAYGIQQMTYVLHRLAVAPPPATLDPHELRVGTAQLLVWEAFVSGRGRTEQLSNHTSATHEPPGRSSPADGPLAPSHLISTTWTRSALLASLSCSPAFGST